MSDLDKYLCLSALLPADVDVKLQHAWMAIENMPNSYKYHMLKQAILDCLTVTSAERSHRLMTLPFLGKKKPSELMSVLLQLVDPPGTFSNDNLHLFLSRLPYELVRNHTDRTADSTGGFRPQGQHLSSSSTPVARGQLPSQVLPAPKSLTNPHGSPQTWRGSAPKQLATPQKSNPSKICFYHQRFGASARSCLSGCEWQALMVLQTDEDSHEVLEEIAEVYVHDVTSYQLHEGKQNFIMCRLTRLLFYIDSGASVSFLPTKVTQELNLSLMQPTIRYVRVADGRKMLICGRVNLTVNFELGPVSWIFHVADVSFPILGNDFFIANNLLIDPVGKRLLPRPQHLQPAVVCNGTQLINTTSHQLIIKEVDNALTNISGASTPSTSLPQNVDRAEPPPFNARALRTINSSCAKDLPSHPSPEEADLFTQLGLPPEFA